MARTAGEVTAQITMGGATTRVRTVGGMAGGVAARMNIGGAVLYTPSLAHGLNKEKGGEKQKGAAGG